MKRVLLAGAAALAAAAAFLGALVVLVNARGGLSPSHAGVKRMPLLGALIEVKPAKPAQEPGSPGEQGEGQPREMPYLRYGSASTVSRMVEELELKKTEYEALLRGLERRAAELEAWEKQLKVERDRLREQFTEDKEELAALRARLRRKEQELDARQVAIEQEEEQNLAATAAIYDRMASERAAEILMEMYSEGQQEAVVKIVHLMQQRTAAKALEAFPDPKIGAQITERLQHIGRADKAGG